MYAEIIYYYINMMNTGLNKTLMGDARKNGILVKYLCKIAWNEYYYYYKYNFNIIIIIINRTTCLNYN